MGFYLSLHVYVCVCIRQTKIRIINESRGRKNDWQKDVGKKEKRFQLLCEYPVNTHLHMLLLCEQKGNVCACVPIKWHKTFIISFDSIVVNCQICLFICNDDFDFQFLFESNRSVNLVKWCWSDYISKAYFVLTA